MPSLSRHRFKVIGLIRGLTSVRLLMKMYKLNIINAQYSDYKYCCDKKKKKID